jgi:hypothetical protein
MAERVSDEELEQAMAALVDERGVDRGVEAATAAMSAAQREQAEESLHRWVEQVRRSIRHANG